ncbi:hypothetical protein T492DRAFT_217281 [Pavlovales sp. CCMP2436]|nr:hypothetical protein T492DRAFT_217281 [Pavlovales sp. CCMP2436]
MSTKSVSEQHLLNHAEPLYIYIYIYSRRPCMFGDGCASTHCLFLHPEQAAAAAFEALALAEGLADDKVEDLLPARARPAVAVAPAPRPLALVPRASEKRSADVLKETIRMPEHLWIDATKRDISAFTERDPIERFWVVNAAHSMPSVLDLHFQSSATFSLVLDTLLDSTVRAHGEAWVLTGSGHHVPGQSHQARGGVLFEAVEVYLSEARAGQPWAWTPARDKNGHYGAFRVWATSQG